MEKSSQLGLDDLSHQGRKIRFPVLSRSLAKKKQSLLRVALTVGVRLITALAMWSMMPDKQRHPPGVRQC